MRVLLLNFTYQPISFVSERKALKLIVKDKVEIISSWKGKTVRWSKGKMDLPATVRLKYYVRWIPCKTRFNRVGVFRRDKNQCQYCGNIFKSKDLTIDHVHPKSKGGKNDWINCVTSCVSCNNKKSDRTLEEAKMKLISKPKIPGANLASQLNEHSYRHEDWPMYLGVSD